MSRQAPLNDPFDVDMLFDRLCFISKILFGDMEEVKNRIFGGGFGTRFWSSLRTVGIPVRCLCGSLLKNPGRTVWVMLPVHVN